MTLTELLWIDEAKLTLEDVAQYKLQNALILAMADILGVKPEEVEASESSKLPEEGCWPEWLYQDGAFYHNGVKMATTQYEEILKDEPRTSFLYICRIKLD